MSTSATNNHEQPFDGYIRTPQEVDDDAKRTTQEVKALEKRVAKLERDMQAVHNMHRLMVRVMKLFTP